MAKSTRSAGFPTRREQSSFGLMKQESKFGRTIFLAVCAAALVASLPGQVSPSPKEHGATAKAGTDGAAGDVERGKYLVENVAMCGQCHTPRNGDGTLDHSRPLDGAPVTWGPAAASPNWPLNAPRIGGTPPASDADMVKLLTTGIWTNGQPLRFPMMPFRMNESDARAVVAYLRSVRPHS
jgi:mono/diheme cytochrome c family protein